MLACIWDRYIHIISPRFVAVGDLLNSTEYSEKLHFSIRSPYIISSDPKDLTLDWILEKEQKVSLSQQIIFIIPKQRRNYKEWTGGKFKSGPFLYRKYERGIKESNVSSSC